MFNADIIFVKQLLQTIDRILEYTVSLKNPKDFGEDYKTFDATLMNFVALGENVNRLSDEFKESNNQIEWRKINSFRNIIAHDYFGVDEEEVFQIVKNHLPKLRIDLQNLLNDSIQA
jgi:uncharacterized protein with HEPN domain